MLVHLEKLTEVGWRIFGQPGSVDSKEKVPISVYPKNPSCIIQLVPFHIQTKYNGERHWSMVILTGMAHLISIIVINQHPLSLSVC